MLAWMASAKIVAVSALMPAAVCAQLVNVSVTQEQFVPGCCCSQPVLRTSFSSSLDSKRSIPQVESASDGR